MGVECLSTFDLRRKTWGEREVPADLLHDEEFRPIQPEKCLGRRDPLVGSTLGMSDVDVGGGGGGGEVGSYVVEEAGIFVGDIVEFFAAAVAEVDEHVAAGVDSASRHARSVTDSKLHSQLGSDDDTSLRRCCSKVSRCDD